MIEQLCQLRRHRSRAPGRAQQPDDRVEHPAGVRITKASLCPTCARPRGSPAPNASSVFDNESRNAGCAPQLPAAEPRIGTHHVAGRPSRRPVGHHLHPVRQTAEPPMCWSTNAPGPCHDPPGHARPGLDCSMPRPCPSRSAHSSVKSIDADNSTIPGEFWGRVGDLGQDVTRLLRQAPTPAPLTVAHACYRRYPAP